MKVPKLMILHSREVEKWCGRTFTVSSLKSFGKNGAEKMEASGLDEVGRPILRGGLVGTFMRTLCYHPQFCRRKVVKCPS